MARPLNKPVDPDELAVLLPFSPSLLNVKIDYHLEENGASLLPSGMYGLTVRGNYKDVQALADLFKEAADRAAAQREATTDGA